VKTELEKKMSKEFSEKELILREELQEREKKMKDQ
jgi:hypothetical protein